MTDYKKMDAELEAAKNITLDEMAEAAADMTAEKQASDLRRASLNGVRLTLAGDPLPIDPDTGEIDTGKLTAEQLTEIKKAIKPIAETFIEVSPGIKNIRDSVNRLQEQIRKSSGIEKMQTAFETLSKSLVTDEMRDLLREMRENLQPIQDLIDELDELKTFIKAELKKEEYGGLTFDNLMEYTPGELLEMKTDPDSLFYKVLEAARAAKAEADAIIAEQQAGRDRRRQLKKRAAESGAIMELRGGNMPVFSDRELYDAFAPGRIARIGTLPPEKIDDKTGQIVSYGLQDGDIIPVNAADISYKTFMLLNAIMANSVDNYREYFVKDGAITFYVKGVLDKIDVDARIKTDEQLNVDRKTAGVLYLEKQLEPLLLFVGTTPNGSRYSVLNYEGYDADADTITIRTPYLYELWKATQQAFSDRKRRKEKRIAEGKKPQKNDLKPLQVNSLFKGTAYKEDDTVLEIATYITNVLLNAGKSNSVKTTEIKYSTLIKNCPRLNEKLKEIEARPNSELLPDGRRRNNTAIYNTELRKIARAYKLIMNREKCDALNHFEFVSFMPSKEKNGKVEFIPPTKSTLKEKITIKWRRIDE